MRFWIFASQVLNLEANLLDPEQDCSTYSSFNFYDIIARVVKKNNGQDGKWLIDISQ